MARGLPTRSVPFAVRDLLASPPGSPERQGSRGCGPFVTRLWLGRGAVSQRRAPRRRAFRVLAILGVVAPSVPLALWLVMGGLRPSGGGDGIIWKFVLAGLLWLALLAYVVSLIGAKVEIGSDRVLVRDAGLRRSRDLFVRRDSVRQVCRHGHVPALLLDSDEVVLLTPLAGWPNESGTARYRTELVSRRIAESLGCKFTGDCPLP